MKSIENTKKELPILKNVYLQVSHFQQNNVLTSNNNHVINDSSVKWGHLAPFESNPPNTILPTKILWGHLAHFEPGPNNNSYKRL